MATQQSMSMPEWKEPDTVADKVLKRAEVSKVSAIRRRGENGILHEGLLFGPS